MYPCIYLTFKTRRLDVKFKLFLKHLRLFPCFFFIPVFQGIPRYSKVFQGIQSIQGIQIQGIPRHVPRLFKDADS